MSYLELEAYLKPCGKSGIFRTLRDSYTCRNIAYSESWNIHNSSIIASYLRKFSNIQNSDIFKTGTYSELSQRFKMEFFGKIDKSHNYFSKALLLRSLTGSEFP